ncbi:MAG TPA: hypothetical protein DDY14_10475 [Chromatiaceae bacterium]|jgi:hypothetical protein|nr:MAG: hypothetical protein N838_10610 [Thiohalocapsa sp. PB-PSB1]QQO53073.1 MAG: hypothetical protein N838_06530 [Thiohalocapsa sp. PB-PSB1]HBG95719.1 hypothetical protein [Chromatiaceae bacterium]HCS90799.1 hypothetical protein [Chromatiaceae bacterium]
MKPQHPRPQSFGAALVCLLFLLAPCAASQTPPVFYVDVQGKSGTEIGRTLGGAIKQRFPDIEKRYDTYLHHLFDRLGFEQGIAEQVQAMLPNIDQRYRDEMEGIASRWQISSRDQPGDGYLSLNEYWLMQLLADIGLRTRGSGFGVWGTTSASGSPVVGRNVDWYTDESLRSLQAITVYQDQRGGIANIGFAGYVGMLSGFNQHGLFLAHLDSPLRQPDSDPAAYHAIFFAIRRALETSSRIAAARAQLTGKQYASSHNILMADKIEVQVLEQPRASPPLVRTDSSRYRASNPWNRPEQIAVVDCYVLARSPSNCYDSQDTLRWQRFRSLARFNAGDNPARVTDIIEIMFDNAHPPQAIFNSSSVQAMAFTPANGKFYLYATPVSGVHEPDPHMLEFSKLILPVEPNTRWSELWYLPMLLAAIALSVGLFYHKPEISSGSTE